MCGILGQVSLKGKNRSLPLLDTLTHRGPDGRGEWSNIHGNVYLGHTRLAILEPSQAGTQPMTDSSNRFVITFNGEIYNHLELRHLLPLAVWKGSSDTETLLELLSNFGINILQQIKGMFAFALHDTRENSTLLVRDRFGIKPLWIRSSQEAFRFSSEVRPLLLPENCSLNYNALSEYAAFGRMPGNGEIFKGIQEVRPGGWIKISTNGSCETGQWWNTKRFASIRVTDMGQCVQRVKKLVIKAIEEHLISDVGVGAFLSGGIDSSIVTLVAGKVLGQNLETFTVGFAQEDFDERAIARHVAKKAGSHHRELEVSENDCLSWVKEAVLSLDVPSVDAINTYIVSKAVRAAGLKVALSGLGGDELFGGYPSFKKVPTLHKLAAFPFLGRQLLHLMPERFKEKLEGVKNFTTSQLTRACRRFTSVANLKKIGLTDGTPFVPPAPLGLDITGEISWAEIHGYMIPMLLRDSDQMSMAVGLEIRVPFLDHNLVEDVLSIPGKYKKGKGVKPLLVRAFEHELPGEVYNRPKQGFALPMHDWIKGPLSTFTNDGLNAAAHFLKMKEPLRQQDAFKHGHLHWTRVWNWCVLGHWLANQKGESIDIPSNLILKDTTLSQTAAN
jgi:asparagine synthase (glutamine-hydrolysing)